jgi:hypothetical protein
MKILARIIDKKVKQNIEEIVNNSAKI